ncbi:MAG: Bro-N domain-containing protein [Bilophila wadsworthia]
MSQSLCFNDFTFSPITRDNQPWFKSSEIARALGYKREDKVTQIYQRNADEFTEGMTQLVEISTEPQNEVLGNFGTGRARIFSLRGCHLLAMFARTPVAKAFRRWVLDVIEQYGDRVPIERPISLTPSTPDDRKPCAIWSTSGQGSPACILPTCGRRCAPASSLNASTTSPWNGSQMPSHGCRARSTN